MARRAIACTICLAYCLVVSAQSSSSGAAVVPASSSATGGQVSIISGAAPPAFTQTVTGLLPVPSYVFASSLPAEATQGLESALPGYSYNLTMEPLSTREAICTQQTTYCQTAGCDQNGQNITTNFCNPTTMGFQCSCSAGESKLLPYITPVNTFDCRLRARTCNTACQNPFATPAVESVNRCQNACNNLIYATCGTPSQISVNYRVDGPDDQPSYAGDTTEGGVLTRSAASTRTFANAFLTLGATVSFALLYA